MFGHATEPGVTTGRIPQITPKSLLWLLRMLREQSVRGKLIKLAWLEVLWANHEYELNQDIKPLYRLLCNSYHYWVATNNETQSRTASFLKSQDDATAWAPERIQNLCPAFFYGNTTIQRSSVEQWDDLSQTEKDKKSADPMTHSSREDLQEKLKAATTQGL
ncbi:hypothetical protein FPQ18DRAFT_393467 [Pyronema domesticum]|nr:hypothetical protein FPQ18DRAFT_393467 [Pyronema domesticum]